MFEQNLDGKNLERVLEEFGFRVCKSLMNHYKKFTIMQGVGVIQLLRDLTEYKECGALFNSKLVQEKFEILRDLANIHMGAPENLQSFYSESHLSKLDKQEILTYVRLRSDFNRTWIGKYI